MQIPLNDTITSMARLRNHICKQFESLGLREHEINTRCTMLSAIGQLVNKTARYFFFFLKDPHQTRGFPLSLNVEWFPLLHTKLLFPFLFLSLKYF